jgi:hypothetical protein
VRLIDDFYHSNHDLLPEGIRLQYQYFLDENFFADTIRDICNLGSVAISWSYNHNASIQWQAETSSQTKKLLDYLTITKAEAARPSLSI